MSSLGSNVGIFGGMLKIEKQKAKLLENVSELYNVLTAGNDATNAEISDRMAAIISSVYSLSRSLGISDEELENSFGSCVQNERFCD